MKRLLFLLVLLTAFASADEITFSYIIGAPGSLTASSAGLAMGPADNVLVSDTNKGEMFSLSGTFTGSTGAASSFVISPGIVRATYGAGGTNSVLIESGTHVLVAGTMDDMSSFAASVPDGTGAFLSKFTVTQVDPAVLALFGLGPKFNVDGSVSATFAHTNLVGSTIQGVIGGGTVTVETPTVVPEPARLGLFGMSLLGGLFLIHYRKLKL